ncbi:MAG: fatty acid desaturase family protein [Bernardetiaceae bacterium]
MRKRVDAYFKENGISKHANGEMFFKTFFFLGGTVAIYLTLLLTDLTKWQMLGLALLLGAFQAFIGFNVSHDAIHGSYSSKKWLNKILGLTLNIFGGNAYVWSITHNVVHHTYTNIPGHDEDLEVAPGLVRLSPEDKLTKFMRYQHLYAFALYGLASISWVFRKDYIKFFKEKIGQTDNTNHPPIEYFNLFFFKFLNYTIFLIIPLLVLPVTWWEFLIGFVLMHMSFGLVLGLVFQLAHVVEDVSFPEPEGNPQSIQDAWADHQMRTTANFARKSRIANFLCGGLNFQIEHHLFPNICHVHYYKISDIVRETALEFDLPYIENETFTGALQSHYRMLKKFGVDAWDEIEKGTAAPQKQGLAQV